MKKERILLTGATGFLGYNIARILRERNYDVTVSVRSVNDVSFLEELSCNICCGSLNDEKFVEEIVNGQDYVIHCASFTEQSNPDFEIYRNANVLSTELLVRSSKKFRVKRFVLVGTANCFTNGTIENPGNENSGFMDFLKNSNYAYSKFLSQQYVLQEARANNFPAVVVAPTFMIGAYDRKPSSGKLLLYAHRNKIVFYPSRGGKSFVEVSAAAEAVVNALDKGKIGECYLLAGSNKSYKEYFTEIYRNPASGKTKYLLPVPHVVLKTAIVCLQLIPTKKNKILSTNLKLFSTENYFTNQKAKRDLEMPDTDLQKSIINSLNWFQNHS